MFGVDPNTPQGMYEIGKGITQRIITLLPAGLVRNTIAQLTIKGLKVSGKGPGIRTNISNL